MLIFHRILLASLITFHDFLSFKKNVTKCICSNFKISFLNEALEQQMYFVQRMRKECSNVLHFSKHNFSLEFNNFLWQKRKHFFQCLFSEKKLPKAKWAQVSCASLLKSEGIWRIKKLKTFLKGCKHESFTFDFCFKLFQNLSGAAGREIYLPKYVAS